MESKPEQPLDPSQRKDWSYHIKLMLQGHVLLASERQRILHSLPRSVLSCDYDEGKWIALTFGRMDMTMPHAVASGFESVLSVLEEVGLTTVTIMDVRLIGHASLIDTEHELVRDVTAETMQLEQAIRGMSQA
jgi:hypothetical protein